MEVISWTSAFVSLAFVEADRSWLSFANRQGCLDMCTLDDMLTVKAGFDGIRSKRIWKTG